MTSVCVTDLVHNSLLCSGWCLFSIKPSPARLPYHLFIFCRHKCMHSKTFPANWCKRRVFRKLSCSRCDDLKPFEFIMCSITTETHMNPVWSKWYRESAANTENRSCAQHQHRHFPRYWPFVQGIHRSLVNSPHKGQWRRALMFSLIYARINGWVNNREAGDLRRHRAHYDVIVMCWSVEWTYYQDLFPRNPFGYSNIPWDMLTPKVFKCVSI